MKEHTDKKVNYLSPVIVELARTPRSFHWKPDEKWQVVTVQGPLSPPCCRVNKCKRTRVTHVTWQELHVRSVFSKMHALATGVHILFWKFRYARVLSTNGRNVARSEIHHERPAPQIFYAMQQLRSNAMLNYGHPHARLTHREISTLNKQSE